MAIRLPHTRLATAVTISTGVALALIGVRHLGSLEAAELDQYDRYVRSLAPAPVEENPVVLIRIDESDLRRYGHPLSDSLLTLILDRLLAAEPRAVAIDIYRDAPVPRSEDGLGGMTPTRAYRALGELVASDPRIIMTMRLPSAGRPGIPAPSFLDGLSQVGFADIPVDPGGIIRRGLLYMNDDEGVYESLALKVASLYLEPEVQPEPDPDHSSWLKLGSTTIPPFEGGDGGYVDADDGGYQFLLRYRGADVPSLSVNQVLTGRFDPNLLRGRALLVGTSASSSSDYFYTPFSRVQRVEQAMHGVEVHGHAVSQLVRLARGEEPVLKTPSGLPVALWVWLWAFLGAALAAWSGSVALSVFLGGVALLLLFGVGFELFELGWWIPVVPPALAAVLSGGLVTGAVGVQERRERREVMGLFSRFQSPAVADEIWRQREQFLQRGDRGSVSRRATVTVLISDLEGFTDVAERLDPDDLMSWVSEHIVAMADEVERHGGVVDDYAGDSVKANFGFPIPRENEADIARDARDAVTCAVSMGARLEEINADWKRRGLPAGRCRIGIYTGPAIVGCIGSAGKLKYTSVGATINTAARLQDFQKDLFKLRSDRVWRLLIGEETLRHLDGDFEVEDRGVHNLRGKAGEIRIFEVLGKKNGSCGEGMG